MIGLDFGLLISGAVITETIFGIPGFGTLTIEAVDSRDYTMIQGIVLVTAVVFVVVNLAVDVLYSVLDPRIRIAGRRESSAAARRDLRSRARARAAGASCAGGSCAGRWRSPPVRRRSSS